MNNSLRRKKGIKIFLLAAAALLLIGGGMFSYYAYTLFASNIYTKNKEKTYINIPEDGWTVNDVIKLLSAEVEIDNMRSLLRTVKILKYENVHSGHYEIRNGMNNRDVIQRFLYGLQIPVKVTFNNIRTKEQLASSLSKQLMPDSLSIIALLNDSAYLSSFNLNKNNVPAVFIPNTYEFFWNVDEERLFERMYKEYTRFWTNERIRKADEIPMTPMEVSILASIVEEETNKAYEYPVIAGLYINRLKKGMLLQADPTVKYALGDFGIRRVLRTHLETDSPYNTYKYKGLPPGPIRVPSPKAIDAVLNYQKSNYLYMAAKETLNGEHNFASNLKDHNNNARKYQRALNRLRIYN